MSFVDYTKYLNYGESDNTYAISEFSSRRPSVTLLEDLMSVNERLVGLLTVITNLLVLLVFVRVLGLTRLASRLIVSVACSNICVGVFIFYHSLAVTNISLSNTPLKCRMLFLMQISTNAVKWSSLASAVLERIIAINMPSQYMASMVVMAPTLVSAPWIYCIYKFFVCFYLSHFHFEDDLGHICQHHLMSTVLEDDLELVPRPAVVVLLVLTLLLVITRTLHPPHYDNLWEVNRLKLEYKTSDIIFQILTPTFILSVPTTIASGVLALSSSDTYDVLITKHACHQIAIYSNLVLFVVMMRRREFRKAFRLLCASGESIRQARMPNYILVATETSRKTKSPSITDTVSLERRTPVTAREDYRSLITEIDMVPATLKKKGKPSMVSSPLFDTGSVPSDT